MDVRCKRHARRVFTLFLLAWLPLLAWGSVSAKPTGSGPTEWGEDVSIVVQIEPYAEITPDPAEWVLYFTGQGEGEDGWLFLGTPASESTFRVRTNTTVQVSLSGGGTVGSEDLITGYTFLGPDGRQLTHDPENDPLALEVAGPTNDEGALFTLTQAEIQASSLTQVPAGRLGAATLTITVSAAGE